MFNTPVIMPEVNEGTVVPIKNIRRPKKTPEKAKDLPMVTFHKENFDDQSVEFYEQIKMDPTKYVIINTVLNDVAAAYRKILPGLMPQLYGSSYTGLAFKNSDIDVHLHCHGDNIPDKDFIKCSGGLLKRSPKFRNTIKVANAKVPVMKTIHISGMELDISATSQKAVHNSILIKEIIDSDIRIKRLIMLISYWAKRNLISGMHLFTNYSIVLLVLFYLQNTEPPMLPPLREILYRRESNGWPYAVRRDAKLEPHFNKSTLCDIYKGFFNFYYNKYFSNIIISLYVGKEIPLEDFSNYETLTSDFNSYKRQIALGESPFLYSQCIHVQDPIELNVNTTKCVGPGLLRKFQETLERFVTKTVLFPDSQWLPILTTEKPITNPKLLKMSVTYPKDEMSVIGNFNQDFETACKLLTIDVEVLKQNKFQKLNEDGSKRTMLEYSLSIDKYIFAHGFRKLFFKLTDGLISVEKFKHELQKLPVHNKKFADFKFLAFVNIDVESKISSRKEIVINNKSYVCITTEFVNGNRCSDMIFTDFVHLMRQYINPLISFVRKTRKGEMDGIKTKPKLKEINNDNKNEEKMIIG